MKFAGEDFLESRYS